MYSLLLKKMREHLNELLNECHVLDDTHSFNVGDNVGHNIGNVM